MLQSILGKRHAWINALTLSFLVIIVAGCVASGYDQAPVASTPDVQEQKSYDTENLLVVIRYPALYDRDQDAVFEAVYQNHILSQDPRPPQSAPNPTPFKDALIKTNYYVMEFYETLNNRLPHKSVALQPQRLEIQGNRIVPTVGFDMPPAVVYVDFLTYVYSHKLITSDSNTFGQFISPFISVRTSLEASPDTLGALVGTDGLEPKASTFVGDGSANGLGYTWVDYVNDGGGNGPDYDLNKISKGPIAPGQYLEVPQVNIDMGSERVLAAAQTYGGLYPDPVPSVNVMNSLADMVIHALDAIDPGRATLSDMKAYIAAYDPALAVRFDGRGATSQDVEKMVLIGECILLEQDFLYEQDENLFVTGYMGAFGDSVRQLLAAEAQHHGDYWKSQIVGALMILGTGLVSGSATGNYMPSAIWDIYFQTEQATADLNNAFEQHFAGVRAQQAEFTVKLAGKVRNIRVSNIQDLRTECQAIYAEEFGVSG